ncbi:hypothetical protein B0H19DRAFT_1245346 [Mycena capillaripes]|nr:hypothetical protein B0H19DRAFT_1245346 [Mycena capillaripes]
MWSDVFLASTLLRRTMYNNPTPYSRANADREGSLLVPSDAEDNDNREDHVLGNVESTRIAHPNTAIAAQRFQLDTGDEGDFRGAGISNIRPQGSRPLPPTPVRKVEGDGKRDSVTTAKIQRVKKDNTGMGAKANFGKNGSQQRERFGQESQRKFQTMEDEFHHKTVAGTYDQEISNSEADPQLFELSADSLSGAEAVSIAKILNANIFQAASFIADSFEYSLVKDNGTKTTGGTGMRIYLGESVTKGLASGDPGLVQIALQTAIARWCKQKINCWCLGEERFAEYLAELYEKILQAG